MVAMLTVEPTNKNFAPVTFALVERVPKYMISELTVPVA
jgi:hypothetical protein